MRQVRQAIPVAARSGVDLRPFPFWDCGFESCQGHVCLSLLGVVCCQVEVSETYRERERERERVCVNVKPRQLGGLAHGGRGGGVVVQSKCDCGNHVKHDTYFYQKAISG
jgi:hypothetical protein